MVLGNMDLNKNKTKKFTPGLSCPDSSPDTMDNGVFTLSSVPLYLDDTFVVVPMESRRPSQLTVGAPDDNPDGADVVIPDNPSSPCCKHIGLLLAILASLAYSWIITVTNYLQAYDYFVISIYRSLFLLFPGLVIVVWYQLSMIPKGKVHLMIFRGLSGSVGSLFSYFAVKFLPVAESSTILQMTPVAVLIIGIVFFKKRCRAFHVFVILLIVGGTVLVAKPQTLVGHLGTSSAKKQIYGLLSGVGSITTYAFIIYAIRALKDTSPAVIITYFGGILGIVSLIGMAVKHELKLPSNNIDFLLLCSIGFAYLLTQIFITVALKYESSIVVSMVQVSEIFFCACFQLFLIKQPISLMETSGIILIVISVMMIGFQRYIEEQPDGSALKAKFRFLLR